MSRGYRTFANGRNPEIPIKRVPIISSIFRLRSPLILNERTSLSTCQAGQYGWISTEHDRLRYLYSSTYHSILIKVHLL